MLVLTSREPEVDRKGKKSLTFDQESTILPGDKKKERELSKMLRKQGCPGQLEMSGVVGH